jgi:hypothetical protein
MEKPPPNGGGFCFAVQIGGRVHLRSRAQRVRFPEISPPRQGWEIYRATISSAVGAAQIFSEVDAGAAPPALPGHFSVTHTHPFPTPAAERPGTRSGVG